MISDIRHDLATLVIPRWAQKGASVYRAWMLIALVLGWFAFRILLIVIYGILIIPMRVAFLLVGYDPLARNMSKKHSSYWIAVHEERGNERYLRKF